jgi:hypothetical protein
MKYLHIYLSIFIFWGCQTAQKVYTEIAQPFLKCNEGKNKVQILYTGCGGLVIASGDDVIMTDPYYTGHGLGWHGPDTCNTNKVLKSIGTFSDPKKIKHVFISHSHYDHFEDLPYLLQANKLADDVKVYSSPSAFCVFRPFTDSTVPKNMDDYTYCQNQPDSVPLRWISISPTMRILPIEAKHAPHFHGIHLMKGNIKCNKFNCHRHSYAKQRAYKWREGSVYSYLLDITSPDQKDTFRIFIQTSSCSPPYGLPPSKEKDKKTVDLAILCAASFHWAPGYPDSLLSKINPSKTLLIHWENFFCNLYKTNLKVVPLTNLNKLVEDLKRHYQVSSDSDLAKKISIPKPLQKIELEY